MTLSRADRQTQALVQLLKALPEPQLVDVLQGVGAALDVPETKGKPRRPCLTCGLVYPLHMKRWGDDHPFDRPKREDGDASD